MQLDHITSAKDALGRGYEALELMKTRGIENFIRKMKTEDLQELAEACNEACAGVNNTEQRLGLIVHQSVPEIEMLTAHSNIVKELSIPLLETGVVSFLKSWHKPRGDDEVEHSTPTVPVLNSYPVSLGRLSGFPGSPIRFPWVAYPVSLGRLSGVVPEINRTCKTALKTDHL